MAEFDQFSHDYRSRLEASVKGVANVDTALASKLRLLEGIISRHFGSSRPGQILDFGSGTGMLTRNLTRFSDSVAGMDVSLDSLRNADGINSVLFDGLRIPFSSESVSVITASCVFHHIPSSMRPQVLAELIRILEPGGMLIIFEHNPYNPVTRWVVNRCEFDENAELLSNSYATKMLEKAGFSNLKSAYYFAIPPVNDFLASADSLLSRVPLGAQFYSTGVKPASAGTRAC